LEVTVYDVTQDGPLLPHHSGGAGPGTHALIIGVGAYTHLNGGSGKRTSKHMDLGQLTSPPYSAFAFADWVIRDFRNSKRPLASVELLVSPANPYALPNGQERLAEAATMANVKDAFDRWFQRCDTSEQNMGIVYFCGHGVLRENTALLLEDYGKADLRAFENAIDMEMTHKGMGSCKANLRCCFIDSCRQEAYKLGKQLQDPATVLVLPEFGAASAADAPIFYASAPGTLAYGLTGSVSRFTEALLKCLNGRGAARDDTGTKWLVTTGSLANAISQIVQEINKNGGEGLQLSPTGGSNLASSIVHEVQGDPEVPVEVCCDPSAATDLGEFLLKGDHVYLYQRASATGPWFVDVKAEIYEASVRFPKGAWKEARKSVWALPPGPHRPKLAVQPEEGK
jgi:hypothetical protein